MNLQPLGDRLIVEVLDEEELTVSGIVLPDTAREKPQPRTRECRPSASRRVREEAPACAAPLQQFAHNNHSS